MNVETLQDLFEVELRKAYSIETTLVDELAVLEDDVRADALDELRVRDLHDALAEAIAAHREETEQHVERLEAAFEALDSQPEGRSIPALDGLIEEKELFNNVVLNDGLRPLYYLGASRAIEQLEITTYDRLLQLAEHLDVPGAVTDALEANREDEQETLRALESLAEGDEVESLLDAMAEESAGE